MIVDYDTMCELMGTFDEDIFPWMCENNLTLHEAFEILRTRDDRWYFPLSLLWHTVPGNMYIKSLIEDYGPRFHPETIDIIKNHLNRFDS